MLKKNIVKKKNSDFKEFKVEVEKKEGNNKVDSISKDRTNIDLSSFEELEAEQRSGVLKKYHKYHIRMTVNKNGHRINFSKALCSKLDISDSISVLVSLKEDGILISTKGNKYKLKGKASSKTLYSSELTKEVVNKLELKEYTEITSKTFDDIVFLDEDKFFIRMKDTNSIKKNSEADSNE